MRSREPWTPADYFILVVILLLCTGLGFCS